MNDNLVNQLIKIETKKPYENESNCYSTKTLDGLIRYRSAEFDQWWDRSLIPNRKLKLQSVCEYLCTYCSYRFDIWFNKELFFYHNCYAYLFLYCKHRFDIWFDKEKFRSFVLNGNQKTSCNFKGYDIEKIYVPEMLTKPWYITALYEDFPDKKEIWLNKNKINFDLDYASDCLIQCCPKDITLWFDKDKFKYTENTCEYFCHNFKEHEDRKTLQNNFKLWWNEEKFDFSKILEDERKITSWENTYSSFKSYWCKKLMLEKLKR
jgi:hypothetical protein